MSPDLAKPVVHLELHTGDLPRALAFYARLFGWRPERVQAGAKSYLALGMGNGPGGGAVECETDRELWLPYVKVDDVHRATGLAADLGATVQLEPREGPAGWRSVITAPTGGQIALWQQKT